LKTFGIGLLGALIGVALMMIGQGIELSVMPVGMTFTEWAGILLASVAIIITALGVVIAVAAIWGFSGIKSGAELAAIQHVTDQLAKGELSAKLDRTFTTFLTSRLRDDKFRRLIEERVDEVLFGGASARAAEDEEEDVELGEEPSADPDTTDIDVGAR
jgi:hypothetical protein